MKSAAKIRDAAGVEFSMGRLPYYSQFYPVRYYRLEILSSATIEKI